MAFYKVYLLLLGEYFVLQIYQRGVCVCDTMYVFMVKDNALKLQIKSVERMQR